MTKTLARSCPICAHPQGEVLHAQTFELSEGHPLAAGYEVVACAHCGFVFADTLVGQQDYDRFYAQFSKYEDNQTSTGGGGSAADRQRLRETAADIAELLPDRGARLLDIGCANGGLLQALRELGYTRLCGVDPSPACVEAARKVSGAEGVAGSLSSDLSGLGKFEGVILSHVLEHVQDLHTAVRNLRPLTQPHGLAYVEVPDASRYAECLVAPFQDFNTEHINHFSAVCLRNLFVRHGWTECRSGSKTLVAGPGMPYPAVFAFFELGDAAEPPAAWEQDFQLRDHVRAYIAGSRALMDRIETQLRGVLARTPEVIVWGTGQLALKLLAETCLREANIAAFVDGNPVHQGKILRGRPILAPSQVPGGTQPIVVASILHGPEIARVIREELRLGNPLVLLSH